MSERLGWFLIGVAVGWLLALTTFAIDLYREIHEGR